MATKTDRPKVLIEQWLPIAEIGAECMRERGASSALPPLYFLHVWWARRPLTVSRAAILASLLPAYPVEDTDKNVRPWPAKFRKRFPTFEAYKQWFIRLIGIQGNPAASRKIIEWAKTQGLKLTPKIIAQLPKEWKEGLPNDMGTNIPYGYPRAFMYNPSHEQLETLYDLLEWTWGTREITFCDPMSGGGSIPFEALRFGLTVHANELNAVASVILTATLDYPARFGSSLADDIRKYGVLWCEMVRRRLEPYYPLATEQENIFCYVWARTVPCPVTGKPVPLSPNWWLKRVKDSPQDSWIGARIVAEPDAEEVVFEILRGEHASHFAAKGTVKGGSGISPWAPDPIDEKHIKSEAQAGRMGEQLVAVGFKGEYGLDFRPPTDEDLRACRAAEREVGAKLEHWLADGLLPAEEIDSVSNYDRGHRLYGAYRWADFFSPRQKIAAAAIVRAFRDVRELVDREVEDESRRRAIVTFLAIGVDKCVDYGCRFTRFDGTRSKICNKFDKHNYAFKWSYAEFDSARNLCPWVLEQILDAYTGIVGLVAPAADPLFEGSSAGLPVNRLRFTQGAAQHIGTLADQSVTCIVVDPPYYRNVMYAECSDFFYVWMKRTVGDEYSGWFAAPLADKDDEAVANDARFASLGSRKKKALSDADYEKKMQACFAEMRRILADHGTLTVMFTHREVAAWDTLGSALIDAGFQVGASWPIHTESEHSTHQAKKNAAQSTIMLACRKRDKSSEIAWWDDLKSRVRQTAREKAAEFEAQGIKGVDLYISTFGPVLSIISENWPVLTSETDPKTGDPLPLKPGEALDLARQEVVNLRKRGLLLGRTVEFDP
jgi:putative DNA methylase